MTWFLVVLIHAAPCPGKCDPVPAVVVQMPDEGVCLAVKGLNPDLPLDCWAKAK